MVQIVLRHRSGARATEIDIVPMGGHRELIIGRARSAAVRFHPEQDHLVGRFHARIVPQDPPSTGFLLTDLGSRNGTFLNGSRISGTVELHQGDLLQFGEGGPEVEFMVEVLAEARGMAPG